MSREEEEERKRKRRNEYSIANYYRYREKYLERRKKRYHSDENVRRHKLEYWKEYYNLNKVKILAYHKAHDRKRRLSAKA